MDSSQCSSNERIVPKLHMALFTFESTLNSGVAGGPTLRCNEAHLGLRAPRTSRSLKTNRRAAQKIEGSWADLTVVIFLYAIIYSYVQLCIVIHKLTGAAYIGGAKVLFNMTDGGVRGSTSRSELRVYVFTSGVNYIQE